MSNPTRTEEEQAFEAWWNEHNYPLRGSGAQISDIGKQIARIAFLAAYAQGAREEREACAQVAEEHGAVVSNEPVGKACSRNIAAAIRRGTP